MYAVCAHARAIYRYGGQGANHIAGFVKVGAQHYLGQIAVTQESEQKHVQCRSSGRPHAIQARVHDRRDALSHPSTPGR